MTHLDFIRSQPPSESVHRALLELDDPADDWPLFMWNGEACRLAQVTMWDAPTCGDKDIVSWKWATGWQCYIVNIAVPLGQPMPVDEVEGPLRDWALI